ncbi:hypothetical protein DSO57_1022477 [Entomophthora muscae]|uniref:Uncharacterized protein n=1 Tax=Entomophthora muscae TaxID=34485 RepID=A0ACC2SS08_9FUNG|nr:hypothetical protein DSO57_1022477 [Entomophthora muscae]
MFLPDDLFAYRLTKHQVTKKSLFTMLYGHEAAIPSILGPPLVEFDAAVNPENDAYAYLSAYMAKSLELLTSNASREPFPEFQDLNPKVLRSSSLQDKLPTVSWTETRAGFDFGESPEPPTPKVPVNLTNESAGQAKDPEITWATAAGEAKKLPMECRPPKDEQSCDPKEKFESSQFEPANERSPALDATEGCIALVDCITRPKGNFKSLPMVTGHTYTLGCQFYFICSLPPVVPYLTSINPKKPWTDHPNFIAQQELHLAWYNFTGYPSNPVYLEFTLEEILIYGPEARTRETETIYREGTKIIRPPLLFCNKYNYLPAYLVPRTPPLTLQPNRPQESVAADESTST